MPGGDVIAIFNEKYISMKVLLINGSPRKEGNTSEIGEFRVISHDFNDGAWRVRWKVGAKQQRIALIDQKLNARPTPLLVAPSDRLGALLFLSGFTYVLL